MALGNHPYADIASAPFHEKLMMFGQDTGGIDDPEIFLFAAGAQGPHFVAEKIIAADDASVPVDVIAGDVREADIENASMVVMNYTLQFLPVADRDDMITRVCEGMNAGGIFVLSEKIVDDNREIENLLVDLHREQKRRNAYSDSEISRKREAIENVLMPESLAAHEARLASAGFSHISVWLRYFNFISMVAIK